jgi:hypothetical protein
MAAAFVVAAALVAVPRAAEPGLFPVPLLDSAELAQSRARYDALADRAEQEGLPFETRAVGDALRRIGAALADASGRSGDVAHLTRLLAERVRAAAAAQQLDALARLRAVQARLFVQSVRAQGFPGPVSKELAALGGDFAARALQNGWAGPAGCIASDDELHTLFTLRWATLTHLQDDPRFRPSLGELRRYYRFFLLYPERPTSQDPPSRVRAQLRLRYAEALGRRDHEFPLALVRGSLLAELGMNQQSAQQLGDYLARPEHGSWALRARNYLLSVVPGQPEEP